MKNKKQSIKETIADAVKEVESWPAYKRMFCCPESNGTFTHVKLKDEKCYICKEKINSLAANPLKWGIALPYVNGNGRKRTYCMGCVIKAMEEYNGKM
jgi:hypothetical protein